MYMLSTQMHQSRVLVAAWHVANLCEWSSEPTFDGAGRHAAGLRNFSALRLTSIEPWWVLSKGPN